jgi:hypothetical protein
MECLQEQVRECVPIDDSALAKVDFVGSTQSSVARMRPRALGEEFGCAAVGDVLVVSLDVPEVFESAVQGESKVSAREQRILSSMQRKLDALKPPESAMQVRCLACKKLDPDVSLHAERSCTQYVYHYLLPLE